ncbi:hypothetical protein [Pseudozobellia sp. WGM2]|uniref:hypothetical protein n=1 Tax=Pseudozobellia sp. WGM2 TaxID=2787625 RepID=UPI001AE0D408|nr:hypothetical protein [Pseudozobellia sp. WGM2]
MKKFVSLFLLIGFLISCSNNGNDSNDTIIEQNVTISNIEDYEYDLGSFGDEEGAGIQIQAKHFEVSDLERDINGQIIYKYRPISGFIGSDYVELKSGRGSDGASENTDITFVKITLNITE